MTLPAVLTHYFCGDACVNALCAGADDAFNCVANNRDIFNLGCQGPDILFFSFDKKLSRLGSRMHERGINGFFAECINIIRKTAEHDGRSVMESYMYGFLCHYALDCATHPYVFYKSGFSDVSGNLGQAFNASHRFLETTIDCIISEKFMDKKPHEQNIPKILQAPGADMEDVSELLSKTINVAYDEDCEPEDFEKSMRRMRLVYRLFRSKRGRPPVLSFIAKLLPDRGAKYALMHYEPVRQLDYLNEQRDAWFYPWNDSVEINFSFMDLFQKAVEDSCILISAFRRAINRQLEDKIALSIIGNKNFSTGLENPVDFLYYNMEIKPLREVTKNA